MNGTVRAGGLHLRRISRPQWGAIFLLMLCQFLVILDTSGFNVALASIGEDFSVPLDQTGAVNLGFVVTLAVMIPLSGWLGERFGTIRILVGGLVVLIIGSIICAAAGTLQMVVVGRVVQGIGSGGLVPLAASLMFRNFEPMQRLRVTAALSIPISLAPALGPLVGGLLVDQLSWRWVFLLSLPISLATIIVALLFTREAEDRAVRRLDLLGAFLTVVGFGASVLGLERLATGGDLAVALPVLAVGLTALAILIPWERRLGDRAFLDVNLLGRRIFAKTTSITAVHSVGFMGFALAGPLLLQTELGLSPFQAGLIGLAGALGPLVSGRIARPVIVRVGPRTTVALSQTGVIVGLGIVVFGYTIPSEWVIAFGVFFSGASSFFTVVSCQTVGFAAVPGTNLGDATAIDGTSRQLGNAVGIAAVSGALAAATGLDTAMVMTVALTLGSLAVFHVIALIILAAPGPLPLPPRPDGEPMKA